MARNRTNAPKIAAIGGGFAALLFTAAGVYFTVSKGDSYDDLPSFPVDTYLDGGNLWSYEAYQIKGRVENVIYRSRSSDRVVASIQPQESKVRLPVVIELEAGTKGVQIEQVLDLKVSLGPDREIICREFRSL
jgi:hypothetical protein